MLVFQVLAPGVDWLDYLSSSLAPLELNDTEPVVLYAREYLQQVSELINKTEHRSEPQPEPVHQHHQRPSRLTDLLSRYLSACLQSVE